MKHLHIDIETYSEVDLTKCGVYRYAQDPSFKILLFAYSWGDDEPILIDTFYDASPGDSIPIDVWEALTDPTVLKIAQNANFEITCIGEHFDRPFDKLAIDINTAFVYGLVLLPVKPFYGRKLREALQVVENIAFRTYVLLAVLAELSPFV